MTPDTAAASAVTATAVNVNDFTILVATVNGTGSQTANSTLIRTIMGMGVPVSGKNIFPSNIQGLTTWYSIRVCEAGWTSYKSRPDVLIAMNPATALEDVQKCVAGAAVIYDAPLGLDKQRKDVRYYPVPFGKLVKAVCDKPALWKLVQNMIYVGVAAELLSLDMAWIEKALKKAFASKAKAFALNWSAVQAGATYAKETFAEKPALRVEHRNLTTGKILIDGNSATALGATMAGLTVLIWYPITPSSSVAEAATEYLNKYRKTPEGKSTFAVVQAEDELAAIGMCIGAGWSGARTMTATSGPGISLMSEFLGLGYYAEVPCVVVNVQRTGPSTGLPTRTMQGDLLSTAYVSHGDTKHPMLLPATPEEAYEFTQQAFDLAEFAQTPVFVMSDLDLGMNNWMCDPFPYPETPIARGKVLTKEAFEKLAPGSWGRYADVDGDGVAWRTLPGTEKDGMAYFTRGTGHDEKARYTEDGDVYVKNLDRLGRKMDTIRGRLPAPVTVTAARPTKVGILAFGTTHYAVVESLDQLARERGLALDYLRIRAFPFADEVKAFFASHDHVYVLEQNRDAQMAALLRVELPDVSAKIRSVLRYDGFPVSARELTDEIASKESAR
ncbi:MAG: 2-oxoacid:acceptor oxidoreductase subunit alpha [Planctomycetes bacterium]|nr:2-oxoacid:acceptor oxidoreductase subunit alpha [Planctomycetota bacterium]